MRRPPLVISVGGSLVAPNGPDPRFLRQLRSLIVSHPRQRFVLVVGGGMTARTYQAAARKLKVRTDVDLDVLGIRSTQLNAELVRAMFGSRAEGEVYRDIRVRPHFTKQVLVAAGFRPGSTTDEKAVHLALHLKATIVINLSNVAGVYTADPKRVRSAKRILTLTWSSFRRMFSARHTPGEHVPFDPRASTLAAHHKLTVIFLDGRSPAALRRYVRFGQVDGTVVSP